MKDGKGEGGDLKRLWKGLNGWAEEANEGERGQERIVEVVKCMEGHETREGKNKDERNISRWTSRVK